MIEHDTPPSPDEVILAALGQQGLDAAPRSPDDQRVLGEALLAEHQGIQGTQPGVAPAPLINEGRGAQKDAEASNPDDLEYLFFGHNADNPPAAMPAQAPPPPAPTPTRPHPHPPPAAPAAGTPGQLQEDERYLTERADMAWDELLSARDGFVIEATHRSRGWTGWRRIRDLFTSDRTRMREASEDYQIAVGLYSAARRAEIDAENSTIDPGDMESQLAEVELQFSLDTNDRIRERQVQLAEVKGGPDWLKKLRQAYRGEWNATSIKARHERGYTIAGCLWRRALLSLPLTLAVTGGAALMGLTGGVGFTLVGGMTAAMMARGALRSSAIATYEIGGQRGQLAQLEANTIAGQIQDAQRVQAGVPPAGRATQALVSAVEQVARQRSWSNFRRIGAAAILGAVFGSTLAEAVHFLPDIAAEGLGWAKDHLGGRSTPSVGQTPHPPAGPSSSGLPGSSGGPGGVEAPPPGTGPGLPPPHGSGVGEVHGSAPTEPDYSAIKPIDTGNRYVWGSYTHVYGAKDANAMISDHIKMLRAHGWTVRTGGDIDAHGNITGDNYQVYEVQSPPDAHGVVHTFKDTPSKFAALRFADQYPKAPTPQADQLAQSASSQIQALAHTTSLPPGVSEAVQAPDFWQRLIDTQGFGSLEPGQILARVVGALPVGASPVPLLPAAGAAATAFTPNGPFVNPNFAQPIQSDLSFLAEAARRWELDLESENAAT